MDDRRLRAQPELLLLQRDGPRVRGDRPGRAADLGAGDARALRRLASAARCSSTTSRRRGRSLHAQEISFNDIRTTLQALYAIFDNCNSLHTNAYDEAITTPTEESVRRAVAIQLIINRELGLNFSENPWQGSFIIERADRPRRGRPSTRSSSGSPSAAACSARWTRCTSAARSRKRASTTSGSSTTARCRSSASTPSCPTEGHGEPHDAIELMRSTDDGEGRPDRRGRAPSRSSRGRAPPARARAPAGGRARARQRLRAR